MKKLWVVLLLFLVAGCSQVGPRMGEKITGNPDGLRIEFLQLQPPTIIRENQDVNVGLKLTNSGVCDISSEVCVSDTLSSVWGGIGEQCQSLNLNGIELVAGKVSSDTTEVYFNFEPYTNLDRDLSTTVIAKSKYRCEVSAGPQLCVKRLVGEDEKECGSFETITGTGLEATIAPITLGKVEKQLIPERGGINLIADITLKKMNEGEIVGEIDPSVLSEKGEAFALRHTPIRFEADYLGYGLMDCKNVENGVFLWRKDRSEETISCELFLGDVDFVDNPLDVRLGYEYENLNSLSLSISDVDRQR